jgi:predicted phage terminase large subunit-like protein
MNQPINKEIGSLQRQMCAKNLQLFAKTYFSHYCKLPFAVFHRELFTCLERATFERKKKIAIAAPRGSAKSSIVSLIYPIWCACYGYEKCIILFSNTKAQAEPLLSHIKYEFSTNDMLLRDFSDVCMPPNPRWRKNEIITRNGVNIKVASVGDGVRGFRFKSYRPSLILVDDIENTEAVRSQQGREKLYDWFTKVVLYIGSEKPNFVVVGTVLHFDSLLSKLVSSEINEFPGFERKLYKSVIQWSARQDLWDFCMKVYFGKDFYKGLTGPEPATRYFNDNKVDMLKDTKVLWPERESYFDLMVEREERGDFAFCSEKQNEPKDPGTLSLDMNKVIWWEDTNNNLDDLSVFLKGRVFTIGSVDPAIKTSQKHDYTAIITAFLDTSTKNIYVVDADIGRYTLDEMVKRICLHHKTRKYSKFTYEAIGAQFWLGDSLKKDPNCPPIQPVSHGKQTKEGRIAKLMLYIQQGKVRLSKRLTELNRQLSHYPNGAHDDAVDALAMLVDMADDVSTFDAKQMEEVLLRLNYPGYDPQNPNKIIGTLDGKGQFKPFNDPFGLLRIR